MASVVQVQGIEAAAEHITRSHDLTRPVRDGVARLLRAAAHERTQGRPLPIKIEYALRDLIEAVQAEAGYQDGDDLSLP